MRRRYRKPFPALVRVARFLLLMSSTTACANSPAAKPGAVGIDPRGSDALDDPCTRSPRRWAQLDPGAPRRFSVAKPAFERGLALQQDGRHREARSAFKEAVSADPTFGLAHLEAGISHLFTDNAKGPMTTHLAAAVLLLPQNPRAHFRFAQVQQETGAPGVAEVHYRCALGLAPNYAPAHEALARLLLTRARLDDAEHHARTATALAPSEVTYRVLLAEVLTRKKRWLEAAVEVERAARQVSRSAALFRRAGDLYAEGGSDAQAARMRSQADILDPPPTRRTLRPLRRRR